MEFKLSQSPDMFIYVFESKRFIDCFYRKNSWEIQICNSYKSSGSRFPENDIEEGYPPPPSYQIFISRNVIFKIAGSRTSIPLHVCITDSTSMNLMYKIVPRSIPKLPAFFFGGPNLRWPPAPTWKFNFLSRTHRCMHKEPLLDKWTMGGGCIRGSWILDFRFF